MAKRNVKEQVITLADLEAKKRVLYTAINAALKNHYIKLDNGEFYDAGDAGYTTICITPAVFDKLYRKEKGAFVEVEDKAIDAFNRLEIELNCLDAAIKAEIARDTVKFEAGKWYVSNELDWNGNSADYRYKILKRTKNFVTVYDYQNDDWNVLEDYNADDEVDGEFDCIFRKKIQYDERGEYVTIEDEEGWFNIFAKDKTQAPEPDDERETN